MNYFRFALISFCVLIGWGCYNPFFLPIDDQPYREPTTPEAVIDNLVTSYNSRDLVGYIDCLDPDSFRFYFDEAEDSIEEILRENLGLDSLYWGIEEERLSAQAIFNSVDELYLDMIYFGGYDPSPDVAIRIYDYRLEIIPSPESKPIRGRAIFTLHKRGKRWFVYRWHDYTF